MNDNDGVPAGHKIILCVVKPFCSTDGTTKKAKEGLNLPVVYIMYFSSTTINKATLNMHIYTWCLRSVILLLRCMCEAS